MATWLGWLCTQARPIRGVLSQRAVRAPAWGRGWHAHDRSIRPDRPVDRCEHLPVVRVVHTPRSTRPGHHHNTPKGGNRSTHLGVELDGGGPALRGVQHVGVAESAHEHDPLEAVQGNGACLVASEARFALSLLDVGGVLGLCYAPPLGAAAIS